MKFKITLIVVIVLNIIVFFPVIVNAQEESANQQDLIDEYYKEQLELSGAKKLWDELPPETKNSLINFGIDDFDWKSINKLKPESVFNELGRIAKGKSSLPIKTVIHIIGIILLCGLTEGMKISFSDNTLSGIIGVISVLCICLVIINPVVNCIAATAKIIKIAAMFMLCYIPIITGLMIASGQSFSATSYNALMVWISEIIAQISSEILVPILNVFLSLSIVSSLSSKMNFKGISNTAMTVFKWLLGCVMTIFVAVLGLQTIVGSSADGVGIRTTKFMINSFVPVVGSALGEALGAIQGSVKLLKSGIGAFGLIAIGFIFIPPLIECILWVLSLNICAAIGDIFDLKTISDLLRSTSKVVGLIVAITLCIMTILIVSTVIVLNAGSA